jgi:hypothetical protein
MRACDAMNCVVRCGSLALHGISLLLALGLLVWVVFIHLRKLPYPFEALVETPYLLGFQAVANVCINATIALYALYWDSQGWRMAVIGGIMQQTVTTIVCAGYCLRSVIRYGSAQASSSTEADGWVLAAVLGLLVTTLALQAASYQVDQPVLDAEVRKPVVPVARTVVSGV